MSHTGRPEFRMNCLRVQGSFSKTRIFMTSGGGEFFHFVRRRHYFHSAEGIYVRKARVVIQRMTNRRAVFFSLRVTPPLWQSGVVARHPSGGRTSLLEGIFALNEPIRARLFYWPAGPNPVVTISTRVGTDSSLYLIRGYTKAVPRASSPAFGLIEHAYSATCTGQAPSRLPRFHDWFWSCGLLRLPVSTASQSC